MMATEEHVYSVLLVSAAEKFNKELLTILPKSRFDPVIVVDSISRAQRKVLERSYDLVIVNTPLPDDFGRKFAIDVCGNKATVAMLLVKSEIYGEIYSKMSPHGVMVARKPTTKVVMEQFFDNMCSVCERLHKLEKKKMSLEEKMEEIRLVNRAKWDLIKSCSMTEQEAHRYIQKQAMDLCQSKREVAENIIHTYE